MELGWVGELDGGAACAAVASRHGELLRVEAEQFYLAARWADLHSGEALRDRRARTGERVLAGMERSRRVGAEGTPEVAEFAAMELGALQGMGHVAAGCFLRDALNVRHRHPLLWAAIGAGVGRVWQARRIAQACAHLSWEEALWVDAATTPYAGSLPWGRLESLVAAKVVEVDPEGAEARRVAAAMGRFVRTGRSSEFGLKTVVARAAAGDVIFFVAMVDRIAEVLLEDGDTDPVGVRRSKAIGILATPERALRMLAASAAAHEESLDPDPDADPAPDPDADADADPDPEDTAGGAVDLFGGSDGEVVSAADVHPSQDDADDVAEAVGAAPGGPAGDDSGMGVGSAAPGVWGRRTDVAGRVLSEGLAGGGSPCPCPCPCSCSCSCTGAGPVDPGRLLPSAVLYLHLSEDALRHGGGVARMEGVGPVTREQVVEFLGHTNVSVRPVIDVAGQVPVDAYEVPGRLREALHLRGPACGGPWSTHTSRRKDADHVVPYVSPGEGGPPGQTGLGNLAWLQRFVHRVKTHGRWALAQPEPGVLVWRSPHGYRFRVDATGTHSLGKDVAQTTAPVGRRVLSLELYGTDAPLDLTGWSHAA